MFQVRALLFLVGTVAVTCNGSIIRTQPCEDLAPLELPSAKEPAPIYYLPAPSAPINYQPPGYVPVWPNYPVNVLAGQAALDYSQNMLVPIAPAQQKPAAPELPAFTMPALSLNDYAPEAPVVFSAPTFEPCENKIEVPEEPAKITLEPIPAAPVLPAFTMPAIPEYTVDEKLPAPVIIEEPKPLTLEAIPAAPELPPFTMPALPLNDYAPEAPVVFSAPTFEPCDNKIEVAEEPAKITLEPIPAAPVLPTFAMPAFPEYTVDEKLPAPVIIEEPKPLTLEAIPAAPELPPFTMPALPLNDYAPEAPVVFSAPTFEPCDNKIEVAEEPAKITLEPIPAAPVLPAFTMPAFPEHAVEEKLPAPVIIEEPKPLTFEVIPAAPELPPFTMPAIPEYHFEPIAEPQPLYVNAEKIPCEEPAKVTLEAIPAAPVLPTFVVPEMPQNDYLEAPIPEAPMIIEAPKIEESKPCDDKPAEPHTEVKPMYMMPVPTNYVASLPPAMESIADCVDKIYNSRIIPAYYNQPSYMPLPYQSGSIARSQLFYPALGTQVPVY